MLSIEALNALLLLISSGFAQRQNDIRRSYISELFRAASAVSGDS